MQHSERTRLALVSALAVLLLSARVYWTGGMVYAFLAWNLFLGWVPWIVARIAWRRHHANASTLGLVPFFAVFVGFLPNAPYMVTDFMHLHPRDDAPLWFDAVMLASFAWAGIALGVASLRACAEIVRERIGPRAGTGFVAISSVLTGFGIYLGRFVRLNTWDVVAHPFAVASNVLAPLIHPFAHARAWTFTPIFAAFFLVSYVAMPSATRPSTAQREESPVLR